MRAEARARLLARQHDEPTRLLGVRRDLRDEPVRADPDRAVQAGVGADLLDEPAHRRARGQQAVEIEVRLVQADDLDALDLRAHPPHDLSRRGAVRLEVGRHEDRVRAQPPRPRRRHRRPDAELARLVGRRRDDRPRPRARHDDRQAAQLGPALQLDARVERVDVEVGDRSHCPTR